MLTIYHNPRCRKSREGLQLLEASGQPFTVVKYLDNPLSEQELQQLVRKLGRPASEIVRTGEPVWKETYRGKELGEEEIIRALARHPKLLERPIVVRGAHAVLGRPIENIMELINN